jgi:mono/diheme cytochrome c family protein
MHLALRACLLAAALVAAAALVSGCAGTATGTEGADPAAGKELFVQRCGGCHTLADAGTLGTVGPNLDWAFQADRREGFAESSMYEIVLEQMKIPGIGLAMPQFDNPDDPENYLSDERLQNIAAYVASVAGTGAKADLSDPKALFTASCGSCHTLADAGTTGTTGPNLDDAKPTLERALAQITNGGGGMPAFQGQLTEEQIKALADYVIQATGG